MNCLGIDTTDFSIDLALVRDGKLILERQNKGLSVAEYLIPRIEELLAESGLTLKELDKIGIINGPGSYTGIRSGLATVLGMKLANFSENFQVVGLSKLKAQALWALSAPEPIIIFSLLTANEKEFYATAYLGLLKNSESAKAAMLYELTPPVNIIKEEVSEFEQSIFINLKNFSAAQIKEYNLTNKFVEVLDSQINYATLAANWAWQTTTDTQNEIYSLKPLYIKSVNAKTIEERKIVES
ncbi:MAG: tRNA (adenosine(37)-N6)-threonylcarbamoyltransferase complex dimerization subunit type 1 TsaB [Deltaproteobacteria bacterium]|jgi:tRNA threonylcarbamoyl adenosine modification protein YeaZ|nr:tRNA (adenosine(37)-N6)-threonylcarbamoyltransferase complex dimerization subunit type 1 TsaB [Deltaproteobacteria bacterium]